MRPINGVYLKEIGRKVKQIREARGHTIRSLGKLCNMHHATICEIENGKRDSYVLTLKIIADKLDVDIKVFL